MTEDHVEIPLSVTVGTISIVVYELLDLLVRGWLSYSNRMKMPHPWIAVGAGVVTFAAFMGGGYYLRELYLMGYAIHGAFGAYLLMGSFFAFKELNNTSYKIRPQGVEKTSAFLDRDRTSARFEDITDIGFQKPWLQRILGTANITLNTSGSGSEEVKLYYVKEPDFVYEELSDLINQEDFDYSKYR